MEPKCELYFRGTVRKIARAIEFQKAGRKMLNGVVVPPDGRPRAKQARVLSATRNDAG
jgi:hypothetical protein